MTDMPSLQDIADEVSRSRDREPGYRRIAVAGEFESGKSSVINALVGKVAVPCNPGLPGRPVVKLKHSLHHMVSVETATGESLEVRSFGTLTTRRDIAVCDIRTPLPGLHRTEIVEIPHRPGTGIDPEDFAMLAAADMIVWVTIGSQAWRLSERTTVAGLPPGCREKSVLAVSRADHLRDAGDWDKIEARLQNEASPFFSEMVFIQASMQNLWDCRQDDDTWIRTGGPTLASIADDLLNAPKGEAA